MLLLLPVELSIALGEGITVVRASHPHQVAPHLAHESRGLPGASLIVVVHWPTAKHSCRQLGCGGVGARLNRITILSYRLLPPFYVYHVLCRYVLDTLKSKLPLALLFRCRRPSAPGDAVAVLCQSVREGAVRRWRGVLQSLRASK